MNNKQIISEEVTRILELMNVTRKKLLIENIIVDFFKKEILGIVKNSAKSIERTGEYLINGFGKITKNDFDDIVSAIDNGTVDILTTTQKRALYHILSNNQNFLDNLYKKFVGDAITNSNTTEIEFIKKLRSTQDGENLSMDEICKKYFKNDDGTPNELISEVLSKKLQQRVDDYKFRNQKGGFKIEVYPNTATKKAIQQDVFDINQLSPAELAKVKKKIKGNYSVRFKEFFMLKINTSKLNSDELLRLIKSTMDSQDIEEVIKNQKLINDAIESFVKADREAFKAVDLWIERQKKLYPQYASHFDEILKLDNYQKAKKIMDLDYLPNPFYDALLSVFNNNRKLFREMVQYFVYFQNNKLFWGKVIKPETTEKLKKFNFFKSAAEESADKSKEVIDPYYNYMVSGTKRGWPSKNNPNWAKQYELAGGVYRFWSFSTEVAATLILYDFIWSFFETMCEILWQGLSKLTDMKSSRYKIVRWMSTWGENNESTKQLQKQDVVEKSFWDDILSNFKEEFEIQSNSFEDRLRAVTEIFPGHYDNYVYSFFTTISSFSVIPNQEQFQQNVEKTKDEIQKEAETIVKSQGGNTPIKQDSIVTATPNPASEEDFKTFLKNKGTQMKDFYQSDSTGTDINGQNYYFDIDTKTFEPY